MAIVNMHIFRQSSEKLGPEVRIRHRREQSSLASIGDSERIELSELFICFNHCVRLKCRNALLCSYQLQY